MSENNNPHAQAPQTNVQCGECGRKHMIEATIAEIIASALNAGWKALGNYKYRCSWCNRLKHPLNSPYFIGDDRVPEKNRGWFVDVKDGNYIHTYKITFDFTKAPFFTFFSTREI